MDNNINTKRSGINRGEIEKTLFKDKLNKIKKPLFVSGILALSLFALNETKANGEEFCFEKPQEFSIYPGCNPEDRNKYTNPNYLRGLDKGFDYYKPSLFCTDSYNDNMYGKDCYFINLNENKTKYLL